jgi:integrase
MLELRDAVHFGRAVQNADWADFKKQYLDWAETNKSPSTLKCERKAISTLEAYRNIGSLDDVSPVLLEAFKVELKKSGLAPATVNRRVRAIKFMMRWGEKWNMITAQNWRAVSKFREPKGTLLFYSPEELARLLCVCNGPWRTLCLLGARAGLRRGEIRMLRWVDVDFAQGRIHIAPREGWEPKDYERRWIPLADDLRAHLLDIKCSAQTPYVFAQGEHRETIGSMTTYFRRLSKKAKLTGNIHTLRHTFASHLAQAGVPLYTISKLLGHASTNTTEIYAHLCADTLDTAITALPKL